MPDGRKPTAPPVDLADIEDFFRKGLNTTPTEFRDHLGVMRDAFDVERDQDDYVTLSADMFLDLLDIAMRMVEMWDDDTHILQVRPSFAGGGFSMQHPIRCRKTGLLECDWWKTVVAHFDEGGDPLEPGSYPVEVKWIDSSGDDQIDPEGFTPFFALKLGDRIPCERDTNGDGDCGARFCPYCGPG